MNENKPVLVGGVGEINFGKQYRQGNRIYNAENIAMCLMSQPVGNSGGYSYLYKVQNKLNNEGENTMKEFTNNLTKYIFEMDTIKLFDSFAGIGSLHQSLIELGVPIEIVGMSEIDVDAIISYAGIHINNFKDLEFEYPLEDEMKKLLISRNIGWSFEKNKSSIPRLKKDKLYKVYKATILLNNLGDISQLDYNNMIDFDLFNFSFPCTDISGAGKQKGLTNEDGTPTRSGLVKYGIEVIKAKKPKYIMIENVKALIQKKFIDDFNDIVNELESYGYKCYYPKKENGQPTCLNAKDYGIAQNRERIFVICVRNDIDDGLFNFPQGFDSGLRLKDFLEDEVDEKYYLDKPWHISTELDEKHDTNEIAQIEGINYKATRSITDPELYCRTIDTMGGGQREPKVLETNYFVDKKDRKQEFRETKNYIQWDTSGKGYTSQVDRAFYENSVVGTIPAMNPQDKTQVIENINSNNFRIRKLTPKECWRLMGFRDECFDRAKELGTSDSALYKESGNSIVVNKPYYIFKELFKKYIVGQIN